MTELINNSKKIPIKTHISNIAEHYNNIYFFIETTNLCNMKCPSCISSTLKRKKQNCNPNNVFKFLDQLYRLGYRNIGIGLHAIGEPLLDINIINYIKKCRELTFFPNVVSNGLLFNRYSAKELYDAGMASIQISFHTPDREAYFARDPHPPLSYDYWYSNILKFLEETYYANGCATILLSDYSVLENRFPTCNIKKWYIDDTDKKIKISKFLNDLLKLRDKIRRLDKNKFDKLIKEYLSSRPLHFCKPCSADPHDFPEKCFTFLPKVTVVNKIFGIMGQEEEYLNNFIVPPPNHKIFTFPLEEDKIVPGSIQCTPNIVLLSDGTISGCCNDGEGELNFGNINYNNLEDVLLSTKYNHFINHKENFEKCRKCKGNIKLIQNK